MAEDVENTIKERGSRYGTMEENVVIVSAFKKIVEESPSYAKLSDMHKECLGMIFHKIARMISGDPFYVDNIHDIRGYAKLLEDYLLKLEKLKIQGFYLRNK